ncbi:MAG: hypothetical protein HXY28_00155 [Hydrogenophilaceae bacterium]|jgi:hypothetical protein|nr:hypothetical protein [Hydrogenophilaceae bacterium]
MRLFIVPVLVAALAGCVASREEARRLQAPPRAPQALILFPDRHELRGSVALEWIDGVSQHSYVLAEPNQSVMRPLIRRALEASGLLARTPVRARYGLRVTVDSAEGPMLGTDMRASLGATYVIVERATGREVFRRRVSTGGEAAFLKPNEDDLRRGAQRTLTLLRAVNHAGVPLAAFDLFWDFDPTVVGQGDLWDGHQGQWWAPIDYDEWSQGDWNEFWEIYRYATLASLVIGPATVGAEIVNPLNFTPFASDSAAARARRGDAGGIAQARRERDGRDRAARAIHRATAANVTAFLAALSEQEGVAPVPLVPCWGSPAVEALKAALLAQGRLFRTDDCRTPL